MFTMTMTLQVCTNNNNLTGDLIMQDEKCVCGGDLVYTAHAGAPGFGLYYKCADCHEEYWYGRHQLINVKDLEPEDNILTINDVI